MSAYLERLEDKPDARCRKWKLIVSKGSGRERRRHTRRFDGAKREAQAALADFAREVDELREGELTIAQFMEEWAQSRCAAGLITERTRESYHWAAAVFARVLPMPLHEVAEADVRNALAALAAGNTPSGRPLSSSSMNDVFRMLRTAYRAAVREGLCAASPCEGMRAPRAVPREKKAMRPAQASEVLSMLGTSTAHEFALSMIVRTGMRATECLSVGWADLGRDGIHVGRQATKTDAGVRTIPLSAADRAFVEERRRVVEAVLAEAGASLDGTERLCCTGDGRPLTYNALRLWWERHRAGMGLEGWTLHELRHTYLTNLAQAGVHPSVMQRLAGHASMQTTLSIYTHVHREDLEKAVEMLQVARQSAPSSAPRPGIEETRSDAVAV